MKRKTTSRMAFYSFSAILILLLLSLNPLAWGLESQVVTFDGGKNSRLEDYLIAPNEAQEADSVDVSSGALKSLKGLGATRYGSWTEGCAPNHDKDYWHGPRAIYRKRDGTWMQGIWDSTISEWNDRYLRTFNDGSMRMMVEDLSGTKALVGLTGPSTGLTATPEEERTWFATFVPQSPGSTTVNYFTQTNVDGNGNPLAPPTEDTIGIDYINDKITECFLMNSYSPEGSGEADEFPTGTTFDVSDIDYLGWKEPVSGMFVATITPGVYTGKVVFEYAADSSLTTWKTLTIIEDTTEGFTAGTGTHWVTWEVPTDWVASSVTQLYSIRFRFTSVSALSAIPSVQRIWPASDNAQDAERTAQSGTGGTRRYLYTWVYKTDTLTLESSPAPPGWDYDALNAEVDTGSYSDVELTIPSGTLYDDGLGQTGLNLHGADGETLTTDLDGGTTEYWEVPVTYVRIYRTRADTSAYFRLVELPLFEPDSPDDNATYTNGILTGYTDRKSDAAILLNDTIDTVVGNNPPVASDGTNYAYPAYVFEHNGAYFMTFKSENTTFNAQVSKKLFWSKVGEPHYVPVDNYIEFDSEIQAINKVGPSLLVITKRGPYLVPGVSSDTYYPLPIAAADHYDCANNATVVAAEDYTLWASRSGIIACDGRTAREIATTKLGDDIDFSTALCGAYWNKQYVIFGSDNAVITDLRKSDPRFFAVRNIDVESCYVDPDENVLYVGTKAYDYDGDGDVEWVDDATGNYVYPCGENESGIRVWEGGSDLEYTYQTKAFTGGKFDQKKVFDRVDISYTGATDLICTLYLDGTAQTGWGVETLNGTGKETVFFDQTNYVGQRASIRFDGKGTVNEVSLKYDWLKNFSDKKIMRGALVYDAENVPSLSLYLDGVFNRTWVLSGDYQHYQIHFNANSQGYIPRLYWTSGEVADVKWDAEPYNAWVGRELFDEVRVTHSEDVTVELHLTDTDGTDHTYTTANLTGDSVSDVYYPANTRGIIPSVIWYDKTGGSTYADLVRKVEIVHHPLSDYAWRYHPSQVCLNWEGVGKAYVYGDGTLRKTIYFGERLMTFATGDLVGFGDTDPGYVWAAGNSLNPNDYCFKLPPESMGRVWQVTYDQDSANSGWIHGFEFSPKEPMMGKLK